MDEAVWIDLNQPFLGVCPKLWKWNRLPLTCLTSVSIDHFFGGIVIQLQYKYGLRTAEGRVMIKYRGIEYMVTRYVLIYIYGILRYSNGGRGRHDGEHCGHRFEARGG